MCRKARLRAFITSTFQFNRGRKSFVQICVCMCPRVACELSQVRGERECIHGEAPSRSR